MKHLLTLKLLFAISGLLVLSACSKKLNSEGCPLNQMCTMEFKTLGVQVVDGAGNAVPVKSLTVTNQRTKEELVTQGLGGDGSASSNHVIVTDGNKKQLSTGGDNVAVTIVTADGRTKTVTYKISGGCNCHVQILSGDTKVVFE